MHKDPQKRRVYAWEWACEVLGGKRLSKHSCRAVIRWACNLYDVKVPTIYVSDSTKRKSFYSPHRKHIALAAHHRTPHVCLHEAAHAIVDFTFGDDAEDHGKEWLGIYAWLLESAKLGRPQYIRKSISQAGLKALSRHRAAPARMKAKAKK